MSSPHLNLVSSVASMFHEPVVRTADGDTIIDGSRADWPCRVVFDRATATVRVTGRTALADIPPHGFRLWGAAPGEDEAAFRSSHGVESQLDALLDDDGGDDVPEDDRHYPTPRTYFRGDSKDLAAMIRLWNKLPPGLQRDLARHARDNHCVSYVDGVTELGAGRGAAAICAAVDLAIKAAAVFEAAWGWRLSALDDVPDDNARFVQVSMTTDCEGCGDVVPVNGLTDTIWCARCDSQTALRSAFWERFADDVATDPEGASDIAWFPGETRIRYEPSAEPSAPAQPVPAEFGALLRFGVDRWYGAPASASDGNGPAVLSVDQAQEQLVSLQCTQCAAGLSVDKRTPRLMTCRFCDAQVYVPDALWRRMHPVVKRQPWWIRVNPAAAALADDGARAAGERALAEITATLRALPRPTPAAANRAAPRARGRVTAKGKGRVTALGMFIVLVLAAVFAVAHFSL